MRNSSSINVVTLLFVSCVVMSSLSWGTAADGLRKNFYKSTCPHAEDIVRNVTWKHVAANNTLPAKLLRMHFHDCFVRGCDGSVLVNSTPNNTAEKDAVPNLSLVGFDVIDEIKAEIEKTCPGVVSCADVLALSARDAVSFLFNLPAPMWEVLTGRRDGAVSSATEAVANIPSPLFNFSKLSQSFAAKGLNVRDLVVLSGGHTIGVGHCNLFSNRLYNFTGRGDQDPSLNATYAAFLKTKCRSLSDNSAFVEMDPNSSGNFDSNYYLSLKQNKRLFQSDAALLTSEDAVHYVDKLLTDSKFFDKFGKSMKKMGAIGVLTGSQGHIRNKCNTIN